MNQKTTVKKKRIDIILLSLVLCAALGMTGWMIYGKAPMIGDFFGGRNSFCGVSRDMALNKSKSLDMNRESYGFEYSNYGYAILGLVLE